MKILNRLFAGLMLLIALPAAAEVRVFACEPEWAALAREVGGGKIDAFSATHARQDPHHIRARPGLIASMRRADLLFCSGGGLEIGWLPILLRQSAPGNLQPGRPGHLMASDHVTVLEKPAVLDRSLGDIHPEGNPHVHLDARNMAPLAMALARRLKAADASGAAVYARQADAFVRGWSELLAEWEPRAAKLKGMPVIVHHKSWAYLVHWLGLTQIATLEPRPGIQPTPAHLNALLRLARARPVRAILRTPYDPPEASDWLSSRTGIPVLTLPYTVAKDAGPGALRALFDETIALLKAASSENNAGR
jgi:zinc/manganese transport system substrate-binding protein